MEINQAGIDLIKRFESCRLKAYPDPGTGGDPWTCGWGSTGEDIVPATVWTQEQADARFLQDVGSFSSRVSRLLSVDLNDNQFSALVCLAYNIGVGNLKSSTLLKCVNNSNFDQAAEEFLKWNKAAGKVLPGLVTRRQAESDLFKA